jgi:hypothetical protein
MQILHQPTSPDIEIARAVAECYADPLRFVLTMYPWVRPGPLQQYEGPDRWQAEFLQELGAQVRERQFDGTSAVAAIRMAISSGHGTGKTVMAAWIVNWIMATRPNARGTITANSYLQLRDKTWAAISRWAKLCLATRRFTVNAERMYHNAFPDSWFCSPQSCKKENSEAFAGQHAADSTSFYIFDEASAVPDEIFEVAEGGLTDGEPMIFLFGNPTRSQGAFYRACFGLMRNRWTVRSIDSRTSQFTNKEQIAQWVADHGENSDFVRVRVRGLAPSAGDTQFIDSATVYEAQQRIPVVLPDEPLVCGLDVARGGSDECVFRFRRGTDAKTIPPIRIPGEQAKDSMKLVSIAADVLARDYSQAFGMPTGTLKVAMMFVDGTGIGGPIVDRLRQLGHENVTDVKFGGQSPNVKRKNMRGHIWAEMREWLRGHGAIDTSTDLEQDLVGPDYWHDPQDRLVLESKEQMKDRGLDSPDDGDALALTFAAEVKAPRRQRIIDHDDDDYGLDEWDWMAW